MLNEDRIDRIKNRSRKRVCHASEGWHPALTNHLLGIILDTQLSLDASLRWHDRILA